MIFYCSLEEFVVFKTRKMGSFWELSKDTYTSEIKVIVPKPPERPPCLPLLVSGYVHDVTLCGHRGTRQGARSKQEKCERVGAPLISPEVSRPRRFMMDNGRGCTGRGEPWKNLLKNYNRPRVQLILASTKMGTGRDMQKWVSALFLLSPSLITQCLTWSDLSVFFIFLFNGGTN